MNKRRVIIFPIMLTLLGIVGFTFAGCNNSDEYDAIKAAKRDNYVLMNKTAESGQFVMIGDSIVEFYLTEYIGDTKLTAYNRGIGGDTSNRMLERLQINALDISPSVVFILVGTNDLNRKKSPASIADNISKAVDKCLESGVQKVLIGSLLPVNKNVNKDEVAHRINKKIKDVNGRLTVMCADKGVTYVDLFNAVADESGNFSAEYTYDGLHPNAKGYSVITDVLKRFL